jgi:hypothetical protein
MVGFLIVQIQHHHRNKVGFAEELAAQMAVYQQVLAIRGLPDQ